jgi:CRISPR/Cas system CMR-associated protein Cmr5 small subunit
MKVVQTFWSKSDTIYDALKTSYGWASPEYHWMAFALSCLKAKELYGKIELITNEIGKEILIDSLGLPYDSVNDSLDTTLTKYPPELWALAKIQSYSLQKEPFFHLDGDVILGEKLSPDALKAPLIAQNIERSPFYYKDILDQINLHFDYVPDFLRKENYENVDFYAINAGVLGGTDLDFIKYYCDEAFRFVDKNLPNLHKIALPITNLNFIFEQFFFYQLAHQKQQVITCYSEPIVEDPTYKDFVNFLDYPAVNIMHPVGNFKNYPNVCNHYARILQKEYPSYYYKIVKLLTDNGVELKNRFYQGSEIQQNKVTGTELVEQKNEIYLRSQSPQFERTHAVIDFIQKEILSFSINLDKISQQFDFQNIIEKSGLPETYKSILLEVYQTEKIAQNLYENTLADSQKVSELYKTQREQYALTQDWFSRPTEEILSISLCQSDGIYFLQNQRNWAYHIDLFDQVIPLNLSDEAEVFPLLIFVPNAMQLKIRERHLDNIEGLIFEEIVGTKTVQEVILGLEECFEAEELQQDYDSFKYLIIRTIKQLLYDNILIFIPNV